ncbi:hypothetical protein Goarm_018870 [Gossypium armourianum]|uniref:Cytochrome P450 n=1 Tax=Gossypium armourianum TaxID=34283 RepID=A0A7J9IIU0_9ROSI|nr:hypothetical protein [Gossypium armourianum]
MEEWHKYNEGKLHAPQVSGVLPIIGHLHLLCRPTNPYGLVFMIRFGLFPTLVLRNHEIVKECLTTNDQVLATCPGSNAEKYLDYDHTGFGFAPHEPFWRKMHKFTMVQLLSTHKLARLNHVRVSEVTALIKDSYSFCKKKEQTILMCGSLKLNMILRLVTGKRYFSDAEGEDDKEANLVMKYSYETWVNEHLVNRAKAGPNDDQDFIDVMLSTMQDDIMCGH